MIHDEINLVLKEIDHQARSNPGRAVDMRGIFSVSVMNILLAVIEGQRYEHNDPKFIKILETIDEIFRAGQTVRGVMEVPEFLLKRFPVLREYLGKKDDLTDRVARFALVSIRSIKLLEFVLSKWLQSFLSRVVC